MVGVLKQDRQALFRGRLNLPLDPLDLIFSSNCQILPTTSNVNWHDIFPDCVSLVDWASVHFMQWLTTQKLKLEVNSMVNKEHVTDAALQCRKLTVVISTHRSSVIKMCVFVMGKSFRQLLTWKPFQLIFGIQMALSTERVKRNSNQGGHDSSK
jgi:hypothetical protein